MRPDTWHRHLTVMLDAVQTAVLDLIDCGTRPATVHPRKPSDGEQKVTDRADGHFAPTLKATGRRSGHSDPTVSATLAWERQVQAAVTDVYSLLTVATSIVASLSLEPVAEDGRRLQAPPEPATRVTRTGKTVVDVGPVDCRQAGLTALAYVQATADVLASRLTLATADAADGVWSRAEWLTAAVTHLARKMDTAPVRRCAAGCGGAAPPRGQGATCVRCRKAASRPS